MGGNESSVIPVIEQESKINHERFANRQIIKNEDGEETIAITVAVPSEREYKAWVEQLEKVRKNEALLLPIEHSFNRSGFCGSAGVVKVIFQNYPFILSDQIHNRQCLSARFFEQNQLWYLALTLLTAVHDFHSRGKKTGDIRPMNVFIAQDGTVKLACSCSWPLQRSNYEKSLEKQVTFLSPEEVIQLAYAKTETSSDLQLAETFSVGLTLLDAATLGDSTELYKNCKQIDYQALETRLADLATKSYSNPLVHMISNMCQASPQGRTAVKDLLEWLTPFENAINNFSPFTPESLPTKFSKSSILPSQSEYKSTFIPKPYISAYTPPACLPPVTYYTSSKPQETVTVPIPSTSSYMTSPLQSYFPGPIGVAQSTYVPFSSKFSLQRIDEQLAHSRKNFPS